MQKWSVAGGYSEDPDGMPCMFKSTLGTEMSVADHILVWNSLYIYYTGTVKSQYNMR